MAMRLGVSATRWDSHIEVEVYFVDKDVTPVVVHPELITSVEMSLLHNENTLLTAVGDKYYGNDDGAIRAVFLNTNLMWNNLTLRVTLTDTSDVEYIRDVMVIDGEDNETELTNNRIHGA